MQQENKMGIMPVGKLVITMSMPIIISMLVQALYNIIDSVYVSYFDPDALTAISLAFSVQNLMIGVATGTGVGVNALLSRALGQKDFSRANNVANNGVFLSLFSFVLVLIFAIFGTVPFMNMMTNDSSVFNYGVSYLRICCGFSFGLFGQIIFERLMQATGKTIYTMITQGLGAVINIILDPLFIFETVPILNVKGFGLGASGAAIATVIGQICAFIIGYILNEVKNKEITLSLRGFKPDFKIIGNIYSIGIPSIIMVAIGSVMNTCFNAILGAFGALKNTAINVFGAYFKLQSFVFMPVFGINNAIIPIIAYNYGAQKRKRMTDTIKYGMLYALIFMLAGMIVMQVFPAQLLSIFNADSAMIEIGTLALRTISLCFVMAAICIVLGSVFQALGEGMLSLLVSVARQLVVLIPAAYILSKISPNLVWWSFPIAEIMSLIVSLLCYFHLYRTSIKNIGN